MSEGESNSLPLFSAALRGGGIVEIYPDWLRDAMGAYPLAQIVGALLVVDPTTPPLPNGMPTPAVQLRLGDGRAPVFTPANPHDANRLLDAIFSRRPDLRTPPPPPGYASGYAPPGGYYSAPSPGYAPGYVPPMPGYPGGQPDYTLAGLSHLSVFFAPVLLPLIVWLMQREKSPYVASQGKQAFFWHLMFTVGTVAFYFVAYVIFFSAIFGSRSSLSDSNPGDFGNFFAGLLVIWGIILVAWLFNIALSIMGAVRAFKGEPFSYPFLGGL